MPRLHQQTRVRNPAVQNRLPSLRVAGGRKVILLVLMGLATTLAGSEQTHHFTSPSGEVAAVIRSTRGTFGSPGYADALTAEVGGNQIALARSSRSLTSTSFRGEISGFERADGKEYLILCYGKSSDGLEDSEWFVEAVGVPGDERHRATLTVSWQTGAPRMIDYVIPATTPPGLANILRVRGAQLLAAVGDDGGER